MKINSSTEYIHMSNCMDIDELHNGMTVTIMPVNELLRNGLLEIGSEYVRVKGDNGYMYAIDEFAADEYIRNLNILQEKECIIHSLDADSIIHEDPLDVLVLCKEIIGQCNLLWVSHMFIRYERR